MAHAAAHVVDVGAQRFTEVGHLVNEADLGREHGVGRVLGHFGALGRHDQKGVLGAQEGRVQLVQDFADFGPAHAHHDAVRLHEILDGCPLFEKFRVGGHVHGTVRPRRQAITGWSDRRCRRLPAVFPQPQRSTRRAGRRAPGPS